MIAHSDAKRCVWQRLLSMLSSGLCVYLLSGLTSFSNEVNPLLWAAVFAACWYGSDRFWMLSDRRAQRCFGWMGFLFSLALTLGLRLDSCGQTGWDGLALVLSASACAGPAAALLFARLAQWLSDQQTAAEASKGRVFRGTFALLMLAWLPALLAYYPGIHAYDTFAQLPEYIYRTFNTHHPLLHTLCVGWLYDLGGALGSYELGLLLYSVLQMLLVAGALAYALQELVCLGCPRWVRIALTALFCLSPQYPLHSIGCTKDIPFAALMLIFLVQLHRLYREPARKRTPRFWAGIAVTGVLMCLMRNNASYALVLFAPVAVLCMPRGRRMRMALLLVSVLVISAGCASGLKAATGAKDGLINEMFSVPAQQLARVYNSVDDDALIRYEIVECVPYADQYNQRLSDPVKLHLAIQTPQKLLKFIKFWGREFFHYPTIYLDAFLFSTKGYWDLNDLNSVAPPIFLWFYDTLGVEQTCYLPQYRAFCETYLTNEQYRSLPVVSLLLQPALYLWLTLFALICALWKRDRALVVIALCALAYLFTLLLGPVVNNRYTFCLTMCAPILLGLITTKNEKSPV